MNIGILTHHWVYNFGANLQALATQSTLRSMGFDPVFINYRDPSKVLAYKRSIDISQAKMHDDFVDRYLSQSPLLTTAKDIEEYCCDVLDVVLVGSDAVFSLVPKYDPLNIFRKLRNKNFKITEELPPYWLGWNKEGAGRRIVKASIAASSMGTNYFFLTPRMRKALRERISDFDYITVRDDWTLQMIRSLHSGFQKIEISPDPVFSLNSNFDLPSEEKSEVDVSQTILMSGIFEPDWLENFIKFAHSEGYKVANCPNPDNDFANERFDFTIELPLSPLAWYDLLARCSGYIGVRFHALVSCLANGTPVVSLDPHGSAKINKSASKMFDLCKRAGIAENFFTPKKLCVMKPEDVFRLLFSDIGRKNRDIYRGSADKKFREVLEKIVGCIA